MVEPNENYDWSNGIGSGDDEFIDILDCFWDFPMESLEDGGLDVPMDSCAELVPGCLETKDRVASYDAPMIHIKPEHKELRYNVEENTASNTFDQISLGSSSFQTQCPDSVSESNNFFSSATTSSIRANCSRRPRSKRPRPRKRTIDLWRLVSSLYYSYVFQKGLQAGKNKENANAEVSWVSNVPNNSGFSNQLLEQVNDGIGKIKPSLHRPDAIRKCTHCLITETPQWREGPSGPRTLCNACGVRYRTGRLFPEYRPAASPTFIPSLHSNLHRKVVAMREKRKKATLHTDADEEPPMSPPTPDFKPMANHLFDIEERVI